MYLFTIKYGYENGSIGKSIVKADNCYQAIWKCFGEWRADDFDHRAFDLRWFHIERWCEEDETKGMEG